MLSFSEGKYYLPFISVPPEQETSFFVHSKRLINIYEERIHTSYLRMSGHNLCVEHSSRNKSFCE